MSPARVALPSLAAAGLALVLWAEAGPPAGGPPAPAPAPVPPPDDPRMIGPAIADRLPDVALTTHRGEAVRFVTDLVRGRVVVVNFMYARCDGSCPGTSALLEELRPRLTAAFGPDARIASVTLDPAADTPAALAEYADGYGAKDPTPGQADWVFLTGRPADVDRLRRALGLSDPDPVADADKSQHAALLTFGNDRTNRWSAQPVGIGTEAMWESILRTAGTTPAQQYGPAARGRPGHAVHPGPLTPATP